MLSFDGFVACISGKTSEGKQLGLASMMPLILSSEWEQYVKRLESFSAKKEKNKNLTVNAEYDKITRDKNIALYDILASKVINGIYKKAFSSQTEVLREGYERFEKLDVENQIVLLNALVLLLKSGRSGNCDLSLIGGSRNAGAYVVSSKLSNWKGKYRDVRIVDVSASGIYQSSSENLLEFL